MERSPSVNVGRFKTGSTSSDKPGGSFNRRSATVGQKPTGSISADRTPTDMPTKMSRMERLERSIFKLLSKIFNPKLTLRFKDVLNQQFPNEADRKKYEEIVDDFLSLKKSKDSASSLAVALSNTQLSNRNSGIGKLVYVMLHDPRTQGFFTGKNELGKNLKAENDRFHDTDASVVQVGLRDYVIKALDFAQAQEDAFNKDYIDPDLAQQLLNEIAQLEALQKMANGANNNKL